MHQIAFLQDLAAVMLVAAVVTVVFHRLKQPVVLGYIIAGVIIGPHTPPFPLIHDEKIIQILAELGVIFLMFSLGLEFSFRKLKEVGWTAIIAASLEIVLMLGVGYQVGRWFGWKPMDSLFLGGILAISSTTIIVKTLADLGKTKERFASLIFGILIVEDILGIGLIAILSGIATTGSAGPIDLLMTFGKLALFFTATVVTGLIVVPRLLTYMARFKSNETLLIGVLGLCFGACLLAAKMGYSVALGAFLMGAIVAEARQILTIHRLMEPIRDMFSAVFFVTIGLLIDPRILRDYAVPIMVITAAVVVGKVFTCSFGAFVAGNDTRTSLRVGMGLAQIGEFSFIIAALGVSLKVTSEFLYPVAVTVSVITTLLTPYLIKSSDAVVNWWDRVAPKPVHEYLAVYTRWSSAVSQRRERTSAAGLIRKWTWQVALNVALIISIFGAGVLIAESNPGWLPEWLGSRARLNAALWLICSIASLPLVIATYRKLQATGMLLGEVATPSPALGARTQAARQVISQILPLAGMVGVTVLVLALTAAMLPPFELLIALGGIAILVGVLLWRACVRLYSKAQIALVETLAETPPQPDISPPHPLLAEAQLEQLPLVPNSVAVGKLIGELRLRTQTGASIVAIQRGHTNIINPGPEEELAAGDQVVLLGDPDQLRRAVALLSGQT